MFDNKKLCSNCGGECCKNMPGAYFPEDFDEKNINKEIIEIIKTGKIAIDWIEDTWDGTLKYYFLRPKIKGEKKLFHRIYGGEGNCIFSTKNGCKLRPENRPHNCRYLEPKLKDKKYACISHDGSKSKAIDLWKPYQYLFNNIEMFLTGILK